MPHKEKTCKNCQKTKPLSSFFTALNKKDGRLDVCIECYENGYATPETLKRHREREKWRRIFRKARERKSKPPSPTKEEISRQERRKKKVMREYGIQSEADPLWNDVVKYLVR